MLFGQYAVLAIIVYGHIALWIAFFNRSHSFRLPRGLNRPLELIQISGAIGLMCFIIQRYITHLEPGSDRPLFGPESSWLVPYAFVALAFAGWNTVHWLFRLWHSHHPPKVLSCEETLYKIGRQFDQLPVRGWSTRLFAYLPTNQMFDLCVNVKTLEVPRLANELDGLTITHLSDLHFTGKITRPFFDCVMDHAESLAGDLIVITGDILEEVTCYEWLQPTLGRLRAPLGIYFVLGNHDRRTRDTDRLRRELSELGMIDVGLNTHEFRSHSRLVQIAGNELPWCGPPVELHGRRPDVGLRMLLSHSPDQFAWARARDFDLMLAGHTHGGHIRLPIIGPIVAPSRYGVQYAGGVFYRPPTLMHVSRGISGMDPLRFNCPPEATKLVLRSAK